MKPEKIVIALSALAQESRLSIFSLLMEGDIQLPAGEISEKLDIPPTTASFHLSQLKSAGLVESERVGRSILYGANKKKARKIARYISGKKSYIEEKDAK